jgi:hypothetical protein
MEDLEKRLGRIGYLVIDGEPQTWRVAQVGAMAATPPIASASRRRGAARNRVLRFWLDRLSETSGPSPYRICRAGARLSSRSRRKCPSTAAKWEAADRSRPSSQF